MANAEVKGSIEPPPVRVIRPAELSSPCVFASPHSGRYYPAGFLKQSRLSARTLRRSEDSFVDELFADVPEFGAPLVTASYARAFVDLNRAPYELDPAMFKEPLPPFAAQPSDRVASGLGTVPRIVSAGLDIYGKKLSVAEVMARIDNVYRPYHSAVERELNAAREEFGFAVLIDCHSMPSIATGRAAGFFASAPDIVLGDRFGTSAAAPLINNASDLLVRAGFRIARNDPYAGGYATDRYGRPASGTHAFQIEIARQLYMDESRIAKHAGFKRLRDMLRCFVQAFVDASRDGRYERFSGQQPPLAAE